MLMPLGEWRHMWAGLSVLCFMLDGLCHTTWVGVSVTHLPSSLAAPSLLCVHLTVDRLSPLSSHL